VEAKDDGGVVAVPAMAGQRLGPDGLRAGVLVGSGEMGRAFRLGPVGKECCFFSFLEIFSYTKINPEISR
jgi:hypothetical protein